MKQLLNTSIFLVSFLTSLLISEFAIRLLQLAPDIQRLMPKDTKSAYQLSSNPIMGYELKANYRDDNNPDLHASFPYVNADGQRDIERLVARIPGRKRILLLGDSVVAGHGIYDLRNTISQQLEKLLGDEYEILNFGVGGYCTASEAELLRVKGLKYQPDAVIIVFLSNDFTNWSTQVGRYGMRPSPLDPLFIYSSLFRLIALHFDLFGYQQKVHSDPEADNKNAIGDNNVEDGMRKIFELSKTNNFRVGVAIWPLFNSEGATDENNLFVPNSKILTIEEIAKNYSFPSIRLSNDFNRDYQSYVASGKAIDPKKLYTIGDHTHPAENGAKLAAESLVSMAKMLVQ
jgi:lysophospholipase L1-like esterase